MNSTPLPLYLVMPAPLTMMLTPRVPQALQLFTSQADADSYAGQFPYSRRRELTTPAAVAELLRNPPGWHNVAALSSPDGRAQYELAELAKLYEAMPAPPPPSPVPPAAPPAPPSEPATLAMPEEDELRRIRVQAYLREVQNS